jgi:DNA repair exonuclease SbcCD ATPase subunit
MRIDHLHVRNFRCYEEADFHFNPRFNLIVGDNGAGKTSVLEALADALGIWHSAVPGYGWRNISEDHIRRAWVGSTGSRSFDGHMESTSKDL